MSLKKIAASQILDSRGNPTVRVVVTLSTNVSFEAQVPSGASKGSYEALELRDEIPSVFGGKGVLQAVRNVNEILAPALIASGLRPDQQSEIDKLMCAIDGSTDKSNLGANAILGVSMAVARAGAFVRVALVFGDGVFVSDSWERRKLIDWVTVLQGLELFEHLGDLAGAKPSTPYILPVPFTNQINGGVHSGNPLAMQEFMVCPVGASGVRHAMQIAAEVYHSLKVVITEKYGLAGTGVGDEGGFAPPVQTAKEALQLLVEAASRAGHTDAVKFAIDPASSEFFKKGDYDLTFKSEKRDEVQVVLSGDQLGDIYRDLAQEFPIALLEDPFAEDDWQSWAAFLERHVKLDGNHFEIVGDDLLATNLDRMQLAHERKACNSLLLKINQIGTITESIAAAKKAYEYGWSVFVSHRSGETPDSFIADLVVGLRAGHIKAGAPCRGERLAKYNRLMMIEELLQGKGVYAGQNFRDAHQGSF